MKRFGFVEIVKPNVSRYVCAVAVVSTIAGCGQNPLPDVFGVTMVEETTCIGLGGKIVVGPNGPYCAAG